MCHHILIRRSRIIAYKIFRRLPSHNFTFAACLLFVCTLVLVTKLSLNAANSENSRSLKGLHWKMDFENMNINIDNVKYNEMEKLFLQMYNLPKRYTVETQPKEHKKSKHSTYPAIDELIFSNIYWQVLHTSKATFHLYSAFFDNRTLSKPRPVIRILAMVKKYERKITLNCQLWYDSRSVPVLAKVTRFRFLGYYKHVKVEELSIQPYLLECGVPSNHSQRVPKSVSLVEGRYDQPTNNLRVIHNLHNGDRKRDFAVCVKAMMFSKDESVRLVEWLELIFLLGADKIFLYESDIHPNMSKVLKHYISRGQIDVKKFSLPGELPNVPALQEMFFRKYDPVRCAPENLVYNDCLYRNINRFKFVTAMDIDEVIMPKTRSSWKEIMESVAPGVLSSKDHKWSSFAHYMVYFLPIMQEKHGWMKDVPHFMHMLQNLHRAANHTFSKWHLKSIHDTQRVLTINHHFAFECLGGNCSVRFIPKETAQLNHYRSDCRWTLEKECPYYKNHTVLDDSIMRFKAPLLNSTLNTLYQLGFLSG
ncbi:uncharacterized protein LOC135110749 [Scylla paramamosain]|uniref:uncharacterized protein LOC135110749 n=1 Tax=Scylla paramamosain TaxID=85552 RepID=UPI003082C42D